jgi:hypothetical protein
VTYRRAFLFFKERPRLNSSRTAAACVGSRTRKRKSSIWASTSSVTTTCNRTVRREFSRVIGSASVYFARMAKTIMAPSAKPPSARIRQTSRPSNRMDRLLQLVQRMPLSVAALARTGSFVQFFSLQRPSLSAAMLLVGLPVERTKCVEDVVKPNQAFCSRHGSKTGRRPRRPFAFELRRYGDDKWLRPPIERPQLPNRSSLYLDCETIEPRAGAIVWDLVRPAAQAQ